MNREYYDAILNGMAILSFLKKPVPGRVVLTVGILLLFIFVPFYSIRANSVINTIDEGGPVILSLPCTQFNEDGVAESMGWFVIKWNYTAIPYVFSAFYPFSAARYLDFLQPEFGVTTLGKLEVLEIPGICYIPCLTGLCPAPYLLKSKFYGSALSF